MKINKPLSPHLLVERQEAVGSKLPPLIGNNQIQRHLRKSIQYLRWQYLKKEGKTVWNYTGDFFMHQVLYI